MGTRIRIMDMDVDVLSEEKLARIFSEYLSNDYLNIAYLIAMEDIEKKLESESMELSFESADLVLPGEKAILSTHHVDVLETGGMVVDYHNVGRIMNQVGLQDKKCYFVARNKSEAKALYRLVIGQNLGLICAGIYTADGVVTGEGLINDINTVVPDMILLSLDIEEEARWIIENKAKINSKLCIGIGSIAKTIIRENPNIPKVISFLHLERIYRILMKLPSAHFFRIRSFKKKLENYHDNRETSTEHHKSE